MTGNIPKLEIFTGLDTSWFNLLLCDFVWITSLRTNLISFQSAASKAADLQLSSTKNKQITVFLKKLFNLRFAWCFDVGRISDDGRDSWWLQDYTTFLLRLHSSSATYRPAVSASLYIKDRQLIQIIVEIVYWTSLSPCNCVFYMWLCLCPLWYHGSSHVVGVRPMCLFSSDNVSVFVDGWE